MRKRVFASSHSDDRLSRNMRMSYCSVKSRGVVLFKVKKKPRRSRGFVDLALFALVVHRTQKCKEVNKQVVDIQVE